MSTLPTYFTDFLAGIRLTEKQVDDLRRGHTILRDRLKQDEDLSETIVETFLQGSYRRATAVRPKNDRRADVDVVVVTNVDKETTSPHDALQLFRPFVKKHYPDKYEFQGRSIGITLSYVDLDLVIASAPSEVDEEALRSSAVLSLKALDEVSNWRLNASWGSRLAESEPEWKTDPLWIPDRDLDDWVETHPLCQLQWTRDKNKVTNGHYINVVKAIKWWRLVNHRSPKQPKSYPLEHIVGHCCPDRIESVAEGLTLTLEAIRDDFEDVALSGESPELSDHCVDQNVFKRITGGDFEAFHKQVTSAADLARRALDAEDTADSARLWRELLGNKFPEPPSGANNQGSGGFTRRDSASVISGGTFA